MRSTVKSERTRILEPVCVLVFGILSTSLVTPFVSANTEGVNKSTSKRTSQRSLTGWSGFEAWADIGGGDNLLLTAESSADFGLPQLVAQVLLQTSAAKCRWTSKGRGKQRELTRTEFLRFRVEEGGSFSALLR